MTPEEKKLWNKLKNKQLAGLKFRRQHVIGFYIVDFVHIRSKTVIEIDGGYHLRKDQKLQDEKRQAFLNEHDFNILRFTNSEMNDDLETVLENIEASITRKMRSSGANPAEEIKSSESVDTTKGEVANRSADSPQTPQGGLTPATPSKAQNPKTQDPSNQNASETDAAGSPPWGDLGGQDQAAAKNDDAMGTGGNTPGKPPHRKGEGSSFPPQFPADFIAEGVDQTRGWFYTLHAIASLVFDQPAYRNVVSNGLVLDKNGHKMSKRLGNAVDPFETIEKYGADAVRWYMISNAQPWDNLKFDLKGVEEVRRRFFGTLHNTYAFYALYANIDEFVPSGEGSHLADRPELDRWVLSRLEVLQQQVRAFLNDYEPTRAARAIMYFVDEELSNWYVRLNRRRFWKGELNADKRMAYETLHTCLLTLSQLMSPIAPFYADRLYRDLTAPLPAAARHKSVHLSYWPNAHPERIDERLNERMATARQLTSMVLSLRKRENIKVRQPLQKILVPALSDHDAELVESVRELLLAETNVKELEIIREVAGVITKRIKPNFKVLGPRFGKEMKAVAAAINTLEQTAINTLEEKGHLDLSIKGRLETIRAEEVEVSTDDIPGMLVLSQNGFTVALDITLTDSLRQEGLMRELVNRLQNLRKDQGLEVTDRISLHLEENPALKNAVQAQEAYLKTEVLATDMQWHPRLQAGTTLDIEGHNTRVQIVKQA
jgi:isoleucyl-tRNA synthetase